MLIGKVLIIGYGLYRHWLRDEALDRLFGGA